jgi:hypothetical protein
MMHPPHARVYGKYILYYDFLKQKLEQLSALHLNTPISKANDSGKHIPITLTNVDQQKLLLKNMSKIEVKAYFKTKTLEDIWNTTKEYEGSFTTAVAHSHCSVRAMIHYPCIIAGNSISLSMMI